MRIKPWVEDKTLWVEYLHTNDNRGLRAHLESGGSPNLHEGGVSVLFSAARNGKADVVTMLLAHGADPDGEGEAIVPLVPIVAASGHGYPDIVKLVVDNGCNVNAQDVHKNTAILAARESDRLSIAKMLLGCGADPTLENSAGSSAVSCSRSVAETDSVGELLRERGYKVNLIPRCPSRWYRRDETNFDSWSDHIRHVKTCAPTYDICTETIVAKLTEWDQKWGISVEDVHRDGLRVTFDRLTDDVETLAEEIDQFCPDVVAQNFGNIARIFGEQIERGEELPGEIQRLVNGVDLTQDDNGLKILARALQQTRAVTLSWS